MHSNHPQTPNFPMFFPLQGRKVLIIGSGNIAMRRINTLLKFGAGITVVTKNIQPELAEIAHNYEICLIEKDYDSYMESLPAKWINESQAPCTVNSTEITMDAEKRVPDNQEESHIPVNPRPFMILACTSNEELNHRICRDGRLAGILVNNASDHRDCDFYFPAIVQEGDIVAGLISAGNTNGGHKLVRKTAAAMRTWLREFLDTRY